MIRLTGDGIGVVFQREGEKQPTGISVAQSGDKWRLDLVTPESGVLTNEFDHLYEALDSLLGMVKTLEKEIKR